MVGNAYSHEKYLFQMLSELSQKTFLYCKYMIFGTLWTNSNKVDLKSMNYSTQLASPRMLGKYSIVDI